VSGLKQLLNVGTIDEVLELTAEWVNGGCSGHFVMSNIFFPKPNNPRRISNPKCYNNNNNNSVYFKTNQKQMKEWRGGEKKEIKIKGIKKKFEFKKLNWRLSHSHRECNEKRRVKQVSNKTVNNKQKLFLFLSSALNMNCFLHFCKNVVLTTIMIHFSSSSIFTHFFGFCVQGRRSNVNLWSVSKFLIYQQMVKSMRMRFPGS